ncbi:MAG: hypothetical protein EOP54_18040 [Sphingobacteriales bacterium]|nr:MAG: hypothetical protein EOP54_18040 [Sphingobacteriales bacterium]
MKSLITASLLFSAAILLNTNEANAQVGIGTTTPHSSAALEINSTNKGILVPRMAQANRPASPATGLLIYQTDNTPGFYVYNGSAWTAVSGGSGAASISLTTRATSPYLSGGAAGPYFFNPVPYQTGPKEVIIPENNPTTALNGTSKYTGFVVPANCTFTKIKLAARVISGGVDNGTNNTTTVTLFKNGVTTGLSVQVTTGSAVGNSGANATTGTITAVGGDIISYQYTQTNQEPTTSYSIVLEGQ